ncbi:MAG: hypothetical protein JSS99_01315 [Actinobacteria bacterium]|nr:hypothetical protein [Actinomycetota bacterium]
MSPLRILLLAATAAALTVPTVTAASAGSAPRPIATLKGSISPSRNLTPGTPLDFTLDTRFTSVPPHADLVLQRLMYLFPHGTVVNGRLFPACAAATLRRARGRLRACPPGSKIGAGTAGGTAVALGVSSRARVTLFNGPGGRSITMNVHVTTPALIDATFSAPFVSLHGRYANKLTVTLPPELKTILDGDIVTSYIHVTTGATRLVHGVRRGYVEALRCPRSGRAHIHGDFTFEGGATASADTTIPC